MKRTWRLGIVALAGALGACAGDPDELTVWSEDFGAECDGAPCGWAQIGGPEGGARVIETLPGEDGLELAGEGVTVRFVPDPDDADLRAPSSGGLVVRAVARCDLGSHLEVRATVALARGDAVTFEAELVPDTTWSGVLPDRAMGVTDGVSPPFDIVALLGVSVRKGGAGSCEVDYLALRDPFPFF